MAAPLERRDKEESLAKDTVRYGERDKGIVIDRTVRIEQDMGNAIWGMACSISLVSCLLSSSFRLVAIRPSDHQAVVMGLPGQRSRTEFARKFATEAVICSIM
jgi:hypothetical protein